jgi:predicted MFS family arabinose efflux permease
MTEIIRNSLRDSKTARWAALGIVSFTMFAGYMFADVMSPLKPMLEEQLRWTSTEYGTFTSAYGWFNVFFLMLIFGGIILDKIGVRLTGLGSAAIMVVGAAIKYWAISTKFPEGATILGLRSQVAFASLGFAIFGVGVEIAGTTVTKITVRWFKGHELALAMGLQVAVARIGTLLALAAPVPIARHFGTVSSPLMFCLILLVAGFLTYFGYIAMDKKLDASIAESGIDTSHEIPFRTRDIFSIMRNKGFWLIAILCVLFYSAVFPFIKYAADLMVNKYGLKPDVAGIIPSLLPLGTLFLTPLFGGIYDKKGKGATIMIIGSGMLILVHGCFSVPFFDSWIFATVLVIILGIALSLVPSALWPSVPKVIPERQLGTAYSLIFWLQNWGLMGVPFLIGRVLDKYCITGQNVIDGKSIPSYNYTIPMLIFTLFGVLALIVAYMLKAEDRKMGYGLELPNIQK